MDGVKTVRLLTFPLQVASAYQDKFERMIKRAIDKVPQERLIDPKLHLIGPIYENAKYLDDNTILFELFDELLARSIDSERIAEAHPSFIHIISQLSRDEAILLYELKKNDFEIVDMFDFDREKNLFLNRKIEKNTIPLEKLAFPGSYEMHLFHLRSLGLIEWSIPKQEPILEGEKQTGNRRYGKIHLVDFGKFFVKACIPENGFKNNL